MGLIEALSELRHNVTRLSLKPKGINPVDAFQQMREDAEHGTDLGGDFESGKVASPRKPVVDTRRRSNNG